MPDREYGLEDIRSFLVKRKWLVSELMTDAEFSQLQDRKLRMQLNRVERLRWFMMGYKAARP